METRSDWKVQHHGLVFRVTLQKHFKRNACRQMYKYKSLPNLAMNVALSRAQDTDLPAMQVEIFRISVPKLS